MQSAALTVLRKYPKSPTAHYGYGTAGFRFEVDDIYAAAIFVRAGMLACARAKFLKQTVGLCVTASHNPVKDNGVKIVDPDGGMLAASWEAIAARAANASTEEECLSILHESCGGIVNNGSACVILGRDTRPHSQRLENAAKEGVEAFGGTAVSLGVVTTPQLHFCVMRLNDLGYVDYEPSLDGYERCLVSSYKTLTQDTQPSSKPLYVDCANGVGAVMFPYVTKALESTTGLKCVLVNTAISSFDKLNEGCGAEHVQKQQIPPNGLPSEAIRCASFDGDADRIVFYSMENGKFVLLDGDKIASLATLFIKTQLNVIKSDSNALNKTSVGCVQTAYANGSSSAYLKNVLGVEAPLVKTGVKYLHHKAIEYDVGVYFEANGHGTVMFKNNFIKILRGLRLKSSEAQTAQKRLIAIAELFNQATGDAMADLLAVDGILRVLQFDDQKWNELYTDLPSRQLKVKVVDRSVVVTNEDETKCLQPASLQPLLDAAMKKVKKGRAFVRPSGTEDVVRVYAEAETQTEADSLAEDAVNFIMSEAGGIPDAKKPRTH